MASCQPNSMPKHCLLRASACPSPHRPNLVFVDGAIVGALLRRQLHPDDDLEVGSGGEARQGTGR